jgi:hypothetical protein
MINDEIKALVAAAWVEIVTGPAARTNIDARTRTYLRADHRALCTT